MPHSQKRFKLVFVIVLILLLVLNVKHYFPPDLSAEEEVIETTVLQLNYLEKQLKDESLGRRMQRLFPEGFVFANALYGLAWTELISREGITPELHARGLEEARYAYKQINSEYGKSIFSLELDPPLGIFYNGWRNYLLAKILRCQKVKDPKEVRWFSRHCERIASAFDQSSTPFLQSYPAAAWPADAFLAIASLKLHDEFNTPKYGTLIADWVDKVKDRLDPETGLVPHSTDFKIGKVKEGARGCSISLILRILSEIDPEFAAAQFELYKKHFYTTRFGLPAIREYPKGTFGLGDVDSGPVIFGVGFAGTIVSIGTMLRFGELETANMLAANMDAFGFSMAPGEQKRFVFGMLPIADAFIAWSLPTKPSPEILNLKTAQTIDVPSRFWFHFYSLLILGFFYLLAYRKWRFPAFFSKPKPKARENRLKHPRRPTT